MNSASKRSWVLSHPSPIGLHLEFVDGRGGWISPVHLFLLLELAVQLFIGFPFAGTLAYELPTNRPHMP